MRKLNYILLVFLILLVGVSSYFIFFNKSGESLDYTYYKQTYDVLVDEDTSFTSFEDLNISAYKAKNVNNKTSVVVTFDGAKYDMFDLDILVIDKVELSSPINILYPSVGLLDENHLNLVTSSEKVDESSHLGFNVGFITPNDTENLLVYFAYSNAKSERITKCVEVKVDATTR